MTHLATVSIVAGAPDSAQDLRNRLRCLGFEESVVVADDLDNGTIPPPLPDILLLFHDLDEQRQLALAGRLRGEAGSASLPLCLLCEERSADLDHRAFHAGVDDVLAAPLDDVKLLAHLRPLIRLSTMQRELSLRSAQAQRLGIGGLPAASAPVTSDGQRLLVVGPGGRDLDDGFASASVTFASNPYQADDLLAGPPFDAAILAPGPDPTPYLDLCAHLRNNPRLFNLPVVVIDGGAAMAENEAYRAGASEFFHYPVDVRTLKGALAFLVRRQRRRWAIRAGLMATLAGATQDPDTGVYSRAFFDACLADRVAFAARGRHLSILLFRIADIEGVREHFGDKAAGHLRRQLAQWISGLLRVEDLTALYGGNEFAAILADTPSDEAAVVMHRIGGVLTYTDFAVKDVYQPVKVWVQEGCAALIAGDDAADLVDRARKGMA